MFLREMTREQLAAFVARYHAFDGEAAKIVRAADDEQARELVQGAIDAGELPRPVKHDLEEL